MALAARPALLSGALSVPLAACGALLLAGTRDNESPLGVFLCLATSIVFLYRDAMVG